MSVHKFKKGSVAVKLHRAFIIGKMDCIVARSYFKTDHKLRLGYVENLYAHPHHPGKTAQVCRRIRLWRFYPSRTPSSWICQNDERGKILPRDRGQLLGSATPH